MLAPVRIPFGTSTANPQINTYNGNVWSNLDLLKLLQGKIGLGDYNRVSNTPTQLWTLAGAEGIAPPELPGIGSLNLANLNAIRANPTDYGVAQAMWKAGNRDFDSEYAMTARPWQTPSSMDMNIRTR